MQTKTKFEDEVIKNIRELPENLQWKIAKIINFLTNEIITPLADDKKATEDFLSVCGTWEDDRSVAKQIRDIHASRKSTARTENIF
jgi:hypothetical protein